MKKLIFSLVLISECAVAFQGFETPSSAVLAHGYVGLGAEGGYFKSKNLFDIALDGHVIVAPVIFVKAGFGNRLEAEITWDVYRYVTSDSQFGSTGDVSDPSFFVKLNVLRQAQWPGLSVQLGAKEPATSNESHVGTDEADIFASLLLGKTLCKVDMHARLGIGIYGDRNILASQEDAFLYGFLISKKINDRLQLGLEYAGQFYKSDHALNRMGMKGGLEFLLAQSWYVHGTVGVGFIEQSEAWGLLVGFAYRDKMFQ
ncbi:MAG TPA: hypothetical protein VJB34_04835 [Bdellovibrionota bacterium]|nr:hypothetical protein [Bdellovibrionota bacterium]